MDVLNPLPPNCVSIFSFQFYFLQQDISKKRGLKLLEAIWRCRYWSGRKWVEKSIDAPAQQLFVQPLHPAA